MYPYSRATGFQYPAGSKDIPYKFSLLKPATFEPI